MAETAHEAIPVPLAGWICRQQGCSQHDCRECHRAVANELHGLVMRLAIQVCESPPSDDQPTLLAYAGRLWSCLEYHWKQQGEQHPLAFSNLTHQLEAGQLGGELTKANVLFEVTLAQALELRQPRAAMIFADEYIPFVESTARRLGGPRAVDAFDNFTAELILPRENSPPRIAGYQGRTSLRSWLRAVVTNLWVSRRRKREAMNLEALPERVIASDPAGVADRQPCSELLRPLLCRIVGGLAAEDRLLIKMLLIDEVPQKQLADCLRIHSGNLTRRKQRIAAAIWQSVQQLSAEAGAQRRVADCLELVLAGQDRTLTQQLGRALSQAFSAASECREDQA